ncbi:cytochrome c biogenesis protein ResB [Corynebacterium sp.]|uniref:cytochrome c biogenesis protein ResB n=1 Tax=Corynebacterium sp. TaxID=1720 RepID=UPI0026DC6BB1|nr:cytochrome c biogenesis protein ResB [Corynebacterium sp.]MDO5033124.1 cytochrome c biogenesis protein ResB [Corynebacterium sp.]
MIVKYFRKAWHWLTSMRTALALLFLLAIAAIPGSLLPQRSLNESNVNDFIENNGTVAEIYDKLQLFDVFSSVWFQAIYVLLMISLVGCIIPRSWDHYKAWRTKPTRAPKYLHRMPLNASGHSEKSPEEIAAATKTMLRKWRVAESAPEEDRAGAHSFSAERGYARELCNLIFHVALVAVLVTVAAGRLVTYEGQVIVVTEKNSQGQTQKQPRSAEFCNTSPSNFDSLRSGPLFDGTGLHPFCFVAHDFTAEYLPNGQAAMFTSNVSYATGDDITTDPSTWEDYQLQVNHPLRLENNRVYLQGHGFAPTVTVEWPNGEKRTQTVQFQPTDTVFFLSSGAMRFDPPAGMYPDLYERRQHQIAIQGLFAPTAEWSGENGKLLTSSYPAMMDPAMAIDIYRGDAGLDTGVAQSLFSLDSSLMHSGQLQKIDRVNLMQGESVTLDDGTKITFDGASEFANFQISYDPFQVWVLISALVMLVSLVGSLTIKRRRVWVRIRPAADGGTDVEMAGLARTDRAGWSEEFYVLYRELLELPDPDEVEEDTLYSTQ